MSIDDNLLEEFVAEAKDHVEVVEQGLLSLEEQPESEGIAKIFRSIHSIKGAAGFLGLNQVNRLSHIMETLLAKMREGTIKPEAHYIDALLGGVDVLSTMIHAAEESNNTNIDDIYQRLAALTKVKEKKTAGYADAFGLLAQSYRFGLKEPPARYDNLFSLTYKADTLLAQDGLWAVDQIRELSSVGEILAVKFMPTHSSQASSGPDGIDCKILYSSIMDQEVLQQVPELKVAEICPLHADELLGTAKDSTTGPEPPKAPTASLQPKSVQGASLPAAKVEKQEPGADSETPSAKKTAGKELSDTIRVQVGLLDRLMALAGELVLVRNQHMMAVDGNDAVVRGISQRLDIVTTELQEAIMRTRMQPVGHIFNKLPRIVRDLSHKMAKKITITTSGNEVEVDKTILEALADPLTHLIRNCCDHGIESPEYREQAGKEGEGHITVEAYHEAGKINIVVSDDGKGIDVIALKIKAQQSDFKTEEELARMSDKEMLSLILLPGFSMAKEVSEVSGRGVGMDVVKTGLEQFGGILELESQAGQGTTVHLQLPLTLAIIPCLIVSVDKCRYAIPQVNLEELVCLYDEDMYSKIECAGNQELYRLRDHLLPLVRFNEVLRRREPFDDETHNEITDLYCRRQTRVEDRHCLNFAVVKTGNRRFGLIVDEVLGTEEIVVKPMHKAVKQLYIYSGATVMGDGQVALILDVDGIARHAGMDAAARELELAKDKESHEMALSENQQVLLFKYGIQEQFAVALPLIKRIEYLPVSKIEKVGGKEYVNVDGASTRILRLNQLLSVSEGRDDLDHIFLLLPKYVRHPFGIVINELLDIAQTPMTMDLEATLDDGLLGSAITAGHLTLFLDVYRLIEMAEPEWFADRKRETPPPQGQKTILLVEDMPFFRKMIKGYLESDNYKVVTAGHGLEGIEMLNNNEVDLIVSDLEMPEMDGWTFIQQVRSNGYDRNLPALALTALTSEDDRIKALAAGFDEYEVKINREELLSMTSQLLHRRAENMIN